MADPALCPKCGSEYVYGEREVTETAALWITRENGAVTVAYSEDAETTDDEGWHWAGCDDCHWEGPISELVTEFAAPPPGIPVVPKVG